MAKHSENPKDEVSANQPEAKSPQAEPTAEDVENGTAQELEGLHPKSVFAFGLGSEYGSIFSNSSRLGEGSDPDNSAEPPAERVLADNQVCVLSIMIPLFLFCSCLFTSLSLSFSSSSSLSYSLYRCSPFHSPSPSLSSSPSPTTS